MKNIVIVGATSGIAIAFARKFSEQKANLFLFARDDEKLSRITADLRVRGAQNVYKDYFDATETGSHKNLAGIAKDVLGSIDIVLIAFGTLPDQILCEEDPASAVSAFSLNATSTISCLGYFAQALADQEYGTLAVITSVAGDRGRRSNYIYGAAKSAISTFLQGLQMRFADTQIHVLDVRPGFVITQMTEAFEKNALWAEPSQIADGIAKAIERKKRLVYLPFYWRWIMLVIRLLPFAIIRRLNI